MINPDRQFEFQTKLDPSTIQKILADCGPGLANLVAPWGLLDHEQLSPDLSLARADGANGFRIAAGSSIRGNGGLGAYLKEGGFEGLAGARSATTNLIVITGSRPESTSTGVAQAFNDSPVNLKIFRKFA